MKIKEIRAKNPFRERMTLPLNLQTNDHMRKMKITIHYFILAILIIGVNSCMVGPNFQKPNVETPASYRFAHGSSDTLNTLNWKTFFADTTLQKLIDSALVNNFDARIAASRILQSKYYLGYTKADQYPSLSYNGDITGNFTSENDPVFSGLIAVNLNWEIGFWGKYRRATEAAQAELAATEYGYHAIRISLISEVANAYYQLLDYKKRLDISKQTLDIRNESLRIITERFNNGIIPEIDLNQAQIQKEYAASSIPVFERLVAFTENALNILLGKNPDEIIVFTTIDEILSPDSIPVGLPSQLLTRRPDILMAEQQIAAQNAKIGVAQALRFPSISLTGMAGLVSPELSDFNAFGSAGAGLLGPVFNFGKNKRRIEMEKERTEELKLSYEKAVISAFRETEDALINISTLERELTSVENQVKASGNAYKLSKARYDGGVTSYLEVLEAERTLFEIELYYTQLLQTRLSAYSSLFKALGGGWDN